MKFVRSMSAVVALSLGAVSLLGAITYAEHLKTNVGLAKAKANPVSSLLTAEYVTNPNGVFNNYLTQMRSYLQTPPRDGVFGAFRIPTLHDHAADNIPAFQALKPLKGKIQVRSAVIGFKPVKYSESTATRVAHANNFIPRITPVHVLTFDLKGDPNFHEDDYDVFMPAWDEGYEEFEAFAKESKTNPQDTIVRRIEFHRKPGWIMAKPVRASTSTCYGCHMNVKKGQPIGYVAALVSEAKN